MPSKPRTNSLADLGLQRFADEGRYYKYGGYVKLVQMLEDGASNAEIGRQFGPPDRPLTKEAIRPLRARWELEKEHPELKQGGNPEEVENGQE